jgi:hypothetical protein
VSFSVARTVGYIFSSLVVRPPPSASATSGALERAQQEDERRRDERSQDLARVGRQSDDEVKRPQPDTQSQDGTFFSVTNFPCSLQDAQSDTFVTILTEPLGELKYREIIQTIADFSAAEALPALVFNSNRVVRLPSEKAIERQHSLTLSTSRELVEMTNVWFAELRKKDHQRDAQRAVPFHTIFKARENRPSLKLFKASDGWIPMEAAKNPPLSFPWLVQPSDRFKVRECDVWHFETQCRQTLRAINFAEAVMQAVSNDEIPPAKKELLLAQLPLALRSVAQIQAAVLGQLVQLRRDRYLSLMQRVESDDISRLRHAPLNQDNELFPADLLREVNSFTKDFLHNSALLNMAGGFAQSKGGARHTQPAARSRGSNGQKQQPQNSNSSRSHLVLKRTVPVPVVLPERSEFVPTASSPKVTANPVVVPSPVVPGDTLRAELLRLQSLRGEQDSLPVGGRLRFFWQE